MLPHRADMQHWGSKTPSISGYQYWGCRCQGCRDAWALYEAKHLAEKKKRGICRSCTKPIWKRSSVYCRYHHLKNNHDSLAGYHKRLSNRSRA